MPSESFAIATPAGFVGIDFAAEITCALEHCFLDRNGYDSSSAGTPRALTLIYPAGQRDGHQRDSTISVIRDSSGARSSVTGAW